MQKLTEILKAASNGVLSEQVIAEMAKLFNEAVDAAVKEKVTLAVEAAIIHNDKENMKLFKEAVQKLDADRAKTMTHLLILSEKVKEKAIRNERKRASLVLENDAKRFKEALIKSVDSYLETKINELIPAKLIEEAALNTQARHLVKSLRQTLAIDAGVAMASVQSQIEGAKLAESAKAKALADVEKKLALVTEAKKTAEAEAAKLKMQLVLESKIATFDAAKQDTFRKLIAEKNERYILENFDFLDKRYETDKRRSLEQITEGAKKKSTTTATPVKKDVVLSESAKEAIGDKPVAPKSADVVDKCVSFMQPRF